MDLFPGISIIIPTHNSSSFLKKCLPSIAGQEYPKNKFEIIVADNNSKDDTRSVAKKVGAKVIVVTGMPPMVCEQRNAGAGKAMHEYVYFLDHDMELPRGFLKEFAGIVSKTKGHVDAWQVPEKVLCGNALIAEMKTFEKMTYQGTPIAAVRIIKKSIYKKTPDRYDPLLSGGPADWDFQLQLQEMGATISVFPLSVLHHEEFITIISSINKKVGYFDGLAQYRKKWEQRNPRMADVLIHQQLGIWYRYFGVFFEQDKWKRTLANFPLYLLLVGYKILMGARYIFHSEGWAKWNTKIL
jgi:glycosyltransferase involved in cell wall biosynthesis